VGALVSNEKYWVLRPIPEHQLIDHPKAIDVLYIGMIEAMTLVVCFFSYITKMQAIQLWLLSSRVSALARHRMPHFLLSVCLPGFGYQTERKSKLSLKGRAAIYS
jgi:hypothetical protein